MTTQADIKLVIERLINIDCMYSLYSEASINEAIHALETLGNQVAEMNRLYQNEADIYECYKAQTVAQAAQIEILRDALEYYANSNHDEFQNTARKALATPTNSSQVLQEWLDSVLGEPTAGITHSDHVVDTLHWGTKGDIHLYKKPEILK